MMMLSVVHGFRSKINGNAEVSATGPTSRMNAASSASSGHLGATVPSPRSFLGLAPPLPSAVSLQRQPAMGSHDQDALLKLVLLRLDSPLWLLRAASTCKRWRREARWRRPQTSFGCDPSVLPSPTTPSCVPAPSSLLLPAV